MPSSYHQTLKASAFHKGVYDFTYPLTGVCLSWHFNYETNYYLSRKCVWKEAKGVSPSHLVVTKFYCSVWICFLPNCNFSRSIWLLILLSICHTSFRLFNFSLGGGGRDEYWHIGKLQCQCPMSQRIKQLLVRIQFYKLLGKVVYSVI